MVRGVGVGYVVGVDVGVLGWGGWGAVGERHDVVFVWEDFGETVEQRDFGAAPDEVGREYWV